MLKGQIAWNKGKENSEITRKKISEALRGRARPWQTKEWQIKHNAGFKKENTIWLGKHLSEQHKKNIGIGRKGKKHTQAAKDKIRLAHLGKPAWNKGKKMPPLSEETRRKIGLAGLGRHHTEEAKKKIRAGHIGKIVSEKTRKRISISKTGIPSGSRGKKRPKTTGKNNWHWRGGITPLNQKIRTSLEYKIWRGAVFKRDNFTCVWCGFKSSGGNFMPINADHYPKRFSDICRENNIKSLEEALNCEELWDINNGRTLCINCHKKTETYGNKIFSYTKKNAL